MAAKLWLIAGANGVGKTTWVFAQAAAVTGSTAFVNVDEIARGLSPLAPRDGYAAAGRVAIGRIADCVTARRSFSLETTLAGRTHLRTIDAARAAGMEIAILYFAVATVETCLGRIARRVAEGGHDVPETEARRRWMRSLVNFPAYAGKAELWRVFDANAKPTIVAEGRAGCIAMRGDTSGLPAPLAARLDAMPPCPEA